MPVSFAHLVAGEKRLSVWHNARGADDNIAAVSLPIGELDVNRPGLPCREVGVSGVSESRRGKRTASNTCAKNTESTFLRPKELLL